MSSSSKIFDRFYDSSDDDDFQSASKSSSNSVIEKAGERLDYMMQFLDRKLSDSEIGKKKEDVRLQEFVGRGGGTGMFKLPDREAVRSDRPPSLEVRPRPLRETQIGRFLRTILCTGSQLWAGTECGVRFWNMEDLKGSGLVVKNGEEDTARFWESVKTSAVYCLVADGANDLVLSGHMDGKIRCWKMDRSSNGDPFSDILSWEVHHSSVLAMVITSYGDLWTALEGGVIKIWSWDAIEQSLFLRSEERHMATLLLEESYMEPRNIGTVGGIPNMLASDMKSLLVDCSRANVWSAGNLYVALWDGCTRELLKVFNVDGQVENGLGMLSEQNPILDDDTKVNFVSGLNKGQSPIGFIQRSRNAILGAADIVRRVASRGAPTDENRRIEALVMAVDGMIWTGGSNGLLVQWDGTGNRIQDFHYHSFSVQCFCTHGSRIWVGYASGTVHVMDLQGNLFGGWVAHKSPIIKMVVCDSLFFTLASHGGIRGWHVTSPGCLDALLSSELSGKEFLYTRLEDLNIFTGTWNVGRGRASSDSLISWLGPAASDVDIIVVGLQEVDMGAGFLAMSAAKETVGLEGSSAGQWWLEMIGKILNEDLIFEIVGSRQLAGLVIAAWVRKRIRANVGDVDAGAVPCGFGRAIGNKGAVGLRMRIYDRILCFVNCHFAAHLDAVNRRNADFEHVYRSMIFSRSLSSNLGAGTSNWSALQFLRPGNDIDGSVERVPDLSESDMVVFLGDLNYRLQGISYDEARDFVSQRCFDWLRERDQLRAEMEAGSVCQGMREAIIQFPPTYKFERHQPGLGGIDSGEKKRIPAWCDRILFRDSRPTSTLECCLQFPIAACVSEYESCMDVMDSDHKPVRCIFHVTFARVDERVRRREFLEVVGSAEKVGNMLEEFRKFPETIISTNHIFLQNNDSILRISNQSSRNDALFEIVCEAQTVTIDGRHSDTRPARASFGFPKWIQITPAVGVIKPGHVSEVAIRGCESYEEEHYLWKNRTGFEESWVKEAVLAVKVYNSFKLQMKTHRVCVRCCSARHTRHTDMKQSDKRNVLPRSDCQSLSASYDIIDHLRNLNAP